MSKPLQINLSCFRGPKTQVEWLLEPMLITAPSLRLCLQVPHPLSFLYLVSNPSSWTLLNVVIFFLMELLCLLINFVLLSLWSSWVSPPRLHFPPTMTHLTRPRPLLRVHLHPISPSSSSHSLSKDLHFLEFSWTFRAIGYFLYLSTCISSLPSPLSPNPTHADFF